MTASTCFPFPCFFSFPFSWAKKIKVPPRFELGLQDSESWVLTITPWDQLASSCNKTLLFSLPNLTVFIFFLKTKLKTLVKSVAVVAEWLRRLTRNQLRSPCTGSNPVNCALFFSPFFFPCSTNLGKRWKKVATPGGTRTHNPWLRRPMPYPLGHGGRDG